eukprot:2155335-Prymnesium_polylepis.2
MSIPAIMCTRASSAASAAVTAAPSSGASPRTRPDAQRCVPVTGSMAQAMPPNVAYSDELPAPVGVAPAARDTSGVAPDGTHRPPKPPTAASTAPTRRSK